jgi:hypothetical protein
MNRQALSLMAVILSTPAAGQSTGVADHHQHLFSPAMAAVLDTTKALQPITARDVIALLDSAGISQGTPANRSPTPMVDREFERLRGTWLRISEDDFSRL